MANTIRIKRRAAGGAAGAPATLANAELAFNEQDDTLYYGKGTGGSGGSASQVIAIGGPGAFQPRDADLEALAGLTASGLLVRTGAGTAAVRSLVGTAGRIAVTQGDGVAGAPTIDLATTGVSAGTYSKITLDAYGRATAGATASLSDLGAPTAAVPFNGQRLTGLAEPSLAQDAATKAYVDLAVQGLDPKQSVKAATTASLAALSGSMTVDGVALNAGDRVLVKDQSSAAQNGIYLISATAWSRAPDMSDWAQVPGAYVFVEQGSVNAENGFLCTADAGGTLGSTAMPWVQFSGAGQILAGAGLTKTGNQIDVVGTADRITVGPDAIDIAASYAGQTSITTLGSITTGTWNGSTIAIARGGTAATDAATARSNLGLAIGSDVQAHHPNLAAIASLPPAADRLVYFTGSNTAALATFTAFGRALVDDADAATARSTLGLGNLAIQAANAVAITGGSIDGITLDGGSF